MKEIDDMCDCGLIVCEFCSMEIQEDIEVLHKEIQSLKKLIVEARPYAHQMLMDARTCGFPEDEKEYLEWLESTKDIKVAE